MHGPEWLISPVFSLSLIAVGLFFLFLALRTENEHRARQHNKEYDGIEISVIGRKVIDTSRGWIFFTLFLGGMAMGGHFLAEYTFHLYDETPIDRVTHGLSGMAITAIFLNLYLTRKRRLYYPVSIGASWVLFVLWEVYEWIKVITMGGEGFIQTGPLDMAIDLWVDTLGSLAICFICDEFTH